MSQEAQGWIGSLIEMSPKFRASPDEALKHNWLAGEKSARQKFCVNPQVLMNLHSCRTGSKLLCELLSVFAQFLDGNDVQDIRETFQTLDSDNNGVIDTEELRVAY